MKNLVLLLVAGLVVGAIIIGCSTKEPWEPKPQTTLDLALVSAPDTSTSVPNESDVSFVWKAKGGAGEPLLYSWFLAPLESSYGPDTNLTSVTYRDLGDTIAVTYTFHLKVTDAEGNEDSTVSEFMVSEPVEAVPDTTAPTIAITQSPSEGTFIATGSSIAFAWQGDDGSENNDRIMYQYGFPTLADTIDEYTDAVTVTFENVAAADPATFYVRAKDAAGNISDFDSVVFVIKPASILYIDDYLWLDANGNIDHVKEREQKQFYYDALEGYAFAEWDIATQGFPDSSDLVDGGGTPRFTTIVYAADSDLGSTSGNCWVYLGDPDNGKGYSIRYFLDQGGNLLLGGALALLDMTQAYPPDVLPGDFEFDWLGLDSTAWCFDYWSDYTWAVKDPNTGLDLPDSMKIDVAKNGDQQDYAMETPGLREEAVVTDSVIYIWGLDIDGGETYAYGHPLGHMTYFGGTARTCLLCFDMFEMPLSGIRQTFVAVLTEFGE